MNINFTPAMRKTVLGGMAALAVAGGALTSCNNKTEEKEPVEITQQDIDNYYDALSNAQQAYLNSRRQEKTDSLNYVKNPTAENDSIYQKSKMNSFYNMLALDLTNTRTPEYRAKTRKCVEDGIRLSEKNDSLYKEIIKSL